MTNSDRLSRLLEGLSAKYESTRIALMTRSQECRAIEIQIDQLSEQDHARHLGSDGFVARAVTEAAWQRWLSQRRADLNVSLARSLAGQALARDAAALAFGRRQAVEKLLDRHRTQKRLEKRRRGAFRAD